MPWDTILELPICQMGAATGIIYGIEYVVGYLHKVPIQHILSDISSLNYDAIYWAMVSLTTVGYGDIYPVSLIGRAIAMSSSFLGIAVVALPAGIITAGYMKEIEENSEKQEGETR